MNGAIPLDGGWPLYSSVSLVEEHCRLLSPFLSQSCDVLAGSWLGVYFL